MTFENINNLESGKENSELSEQQAREHAEKNIAEQEQVLELNSDREGIVNILREFGIPVREDDEDSLREAA